VPATKAPAAQADHEEIGLAPLEEEKREKKGAQDSNDLASTTDDLTSATRDTVAERPRRSLVEEALEAEAKQQRAVKERFQTKSGEINPLRPPGFSGPSYGTPTWVWVAVGVGVVVLLGIVAVFALS
jgi:hypothetical protein